MENRVLANQRRKEYWIKFLIREIIIGICFIICYLAPSFIKFIGFIGSLLFMFLGMVMPPITYAFYLRNELTGLRKIGQFILIAVTIVLWILATVFSAIELANDN